MRKTLVSRIGLCIALACTMAVAGCVISHGDHLRGKAKRTDNLTSPAGSVKALRVSTNVGAIKLNPAQTAEVHITADITVKARTEEQAQALLDGVHISAEPSGDTLVVKADKPAHFGNSQLSVDFTITAPADLPLDCTTNVGDIRVDGFTSRVETRTDVGSITCAGLRDAARVHTNVGDVRVAYAPDAPAEIHVDASTNVGKIDFTGPSQISATLTAATNVGDIHTDRPLTVRGTVGKSLNASLGAAEGKIDLRTNVGSVSIR
ncbi:MAG: DUF4097 family beta strand repeat protein [Sedimentisphaerales bacterium]|nr:DUF4097 family beta strand repeat protein [Sedimentisphaerales bacterium]